MERAERSKFWQKMSKETTLAINHATRVAIRKSSLKKFAFLILTLITRHTLINNTRFIFYNNLLIGQEASVHCPH